MDGNTDLFAIICILAHFIVYCQKWVDDHDLGRSRVYTHNTKGKPKLVLETDNLGIVTQADTFAQCLSHTKIDRNVIARKWNVTATQLTYCRQNTAWNNLSPNSSTGRDEHELCILHPARHQRPHQSASCKNTPLYRSIDGTFLRQRWGWFPYYIGQWVRKTTEIYPLKGQDGDCIANRKYSLKSRKYYQK